MDALSETLRVVQLVGAIFINARFTAPWCYKSPSAAAAAPILEPGAERVVIFYLVTTLLSCKLLRGSCYCLSECLVLSYIVVNFCFVISVIRQCREDLPRCQIKLLNDFFN